MCYKINSVCFKIHSTVLPLYAATLTNSPLMRPQFWSATPLSLYVIYPSPTATPLMQPHFQIPDAGHVRGGLLY